MKEICLTRGYVALVDDGDHERVVSAGPWYARPDKSTVYAGHTMPRGPDGKQKTVSLHRFLLGITDPKIKVDHKDGDGLNNQRSNLRIATNSQNAANHRRRPGRIHGVSRHGNRWQAHIRFNRKLIYLGSFIRKEDAAAAYRAAALEHFGSFARFIKKTGRVSLRRS